MSLLTSVTEESKGVSQFIEASYTAGGAAMIATGSAAGIARIAPATQGPSAGNAFLRAGPGASALSLGASDAVNSAISMTVTPSVATFLNTDVNVTVPGTALAVSNSIVATAGAPGAGTLATFCNRDVNGFSDSGYSNLTTTVVGGGAIANPAGLSPGVWSVIVTPQGAGNEAAQASAVCFWSGAVWSGNGVSFNFTAGAPNVAIGPVAGGATLNLGGASIPAGNIDIRYKQLLAAP